MLYRQIAYLCFFMAFFTSANCQNFKGNCKASGSIKQIVEIQYRLQPAENNAERMDTIKVDTFHYDSSGNILRGSSKGYQGNKVQMTVQSSFVYDEKGRRKENMDEVVIVADKDSVKTVTHFNYQGDLLDNIQSVTNHGGLLILYTTHCFYDKQHKKKEEVHKMIGINTTSKDTVSQMHTLSRFNEYEQLVFQKKTTEFSGVKEPPTTTIWYFSYNKCLLISEVQKDAHEKTVATFSYKYKIDKRGNWIRQDKITNNKIVGTITRELTYF